MVHITGLLRRTLVFGVTFIYLKLFQSPFVSYMYVQIAKATKKDTEVMSFFSITVLAFTFSNSRNVFLCVNLNL